MDVQGQFSKVKLGKHAGTGASVAIKVQQPLLFLKSMRALLVVEECVLLGRGLRSASAHLCEMASSKDINAGSEGR